MQHIAVTIVKIVPKEVLKDSCPLKLTFIGEPYMSTFYLTVFYQKCLKLKLIYIYF